MNQEILKMRVWQLADKLQRKEISAREVTSAYLEQIEKNDKKYAAYLTVTRETAMRQAEDIDRRRIEGELLPTLAGIPMAVKDNICTKGIKTTCASRMLEDYIPPYDAGVLEQTGMKDTVLLGKTNMDEFAMGSTTENSAFGTTYNPHDTAYVPGGSSGGSAAAVAAQEAAFALGTDTGGSIRQPAAFCGIVGMKPTYGTVSRYGLIAFASSLDQIGPLCKDVHDCALVLQAMMGKDARDSTSLPGCERNDLVDALEKGVKGLRVALPQEYFEYGISWEVKESVRKAAIKLQSLGAFVEEISLPSIEGALSAYYVISSAEASSNLARFDGIKYGKRTERYEDLSSLYQKTRSEGFGREVKRRIMLGSFVLSAGYYENYYKKALQVRKWIVQDFARIFRSFDIILAPVSPHTAYRIGEKIKNPMEMYRDDIYTVPASIAGLPALSMPCRAPTKMPVGMQFIAPPMGEDVILRTAYAYENAMEEEGGVYYGKI